MGRNRNQKKRFVVEESSYINRPKMVAKMSQSDEKMGNRMEGCRPYHTVNNKVLSVVAILEDLENEISEMRRSVCESKQSLFPRNKELAELALQRQVEIERKINSLYGRLTEAKATVKGPSHETAFLESRCAALEKVYKEIFKNMRRRNI